MALQSHLAELERRHQALEKQIEHEALRPGADDLRLAELKRRKLQLKDEIEKIRHWNSEANAALASSNVNSRFNSVSRRGHAAAFCWRAFRPRSPSPGV